MVQTVNDLVTIGIPVYNAEMYLKDAIQSVLNQSYSEWELIIIDDGSTDNSLNIAQSFSDKRIKVISDGVNRGLIYRLNELTRLATGKYYARMDADDIMHFNRLNKQVNFLNQFSSVDVLGTAYYSIDKDNNILGETILNEKPDSVDSILKFGCFAHPSVMGRIEWFVNNPYSESWKRMEDFELWLRTVSSSHFRNLSEPLIFYRNIGVPMIQKYIKSNLGIIRLLLKGKMYDLNLSSRVFYSIKCLLKILVYFCFYTVGRLDIIIQKRSKPIPKFRLKVIIDFLNLSLSKY